MPVKPGQGRPSTPELQAELQKALDGHFGESRPIRTLHREQSAYSSSFPVEELTVCFRDGHSQSLIFKDLGWNSLGEEAVLAKPEFLHNPMREIAAYETLLSPGRLGPIYFGSAVDADYERYWIFLEKIDGLELYQVGELELWKAAADWLAHMHVRFLGREEELAATGHLLQHDRSFYKQWIRRAQEFANEEQAVFLDRLASSYAPVVDRIMSLPRTLVHGEFYASNVLARQTDDGVDVYPVDWELAAAGAGLTDLAALIGGDWAPEERDEIAGAYLDAFDRCGRRARGDGDFHEVLLCCRLQLAIQWLGWSPNWKPPARLAHDWYGEAVHVAGELGL